MIQCNNHISSAHGPNGYVFFFTTLWWKLLRRKLWSLYVLPLCICYLFRKLFVEEFWKLKWVDRSDRLKDGILFATSRNQVRCTFVNCWHLKNNFTAPWLSNLVGCSYFLSKNSVKILWDKKRIDFFFKFTFCKESSLHVSLWTQLSWHNRGCFCLNP